MKKYSIILSVVLFSMLISCTDFEEDDYGFTNGVYIGDAKGSGIISMTLSTNGDGNTTISARLAKIADEDVTVKIAVDKAMLEEYNNKNGSNLIAVNAKDFVFVNKARKETNGEAIVVIKKGNFKSDIEVKIKALDEKKYPVSKSFSIPITIVDASKFRVLNSPKSIIIKLDRQIKTSVGVISGGGLKLTAKTPFTEPMNEWTFQMSAIYSSLNRSNLTTAYINGGLGGEFYTRINSELGIQIKNGRDGDDTWTHGLVEAKKWLNISYVYKERTLSVYVNGELHKKFETTVMSVGEGWTIGNGGYNNDYIREIRFWNRALTKGEIVEKLYLPQDPKSPGLLMYAPITKKDGFSDLTGNWTSELQSGASIEYVENVVFPADALFIEE